MRWRRMGKIDDNATQPPRGSRVDWAAIDGGNWGSDAPDASDRPISPDVFRSDDDLQPERSGAYKTDGNGRIIAIDADVVV